MIRDSSIWGSDLAEMIREEYSVASKEGTFKTVSKTSSFPYPLPFTSWNNCREFPSSSELAEDIDGNFGLLKLVGKRNTFTGAQIYTFLDIALLEMPGSSRCYTHLRVEPI